MRISQQTVDRVRERAQILDQFDDAQLRKLGREFVTRCPWHDDRRPSLTISPQKGFAYCHVCARGVDAIGWIQDRNGLSFSEAILELASRYGIEVQAEDEADSERLKEEAIQRAELLKQAAESRDKFVNLLYDHQPAMDYLLGRGLDLETITEWELGWNGARVMFPLCDPQGRVIGFTGRVLDDSKPKYKNSLNNLIFNKSELVFGLDRAKDEILRSGNIVIVEGQFDVIRCWQEGIRNMVAVSGSSLTSAMVESIVRTTRAKRVTLCFDGDQGGLKAADRALAELQQLVLRGELELQILSLPDGLDPADCAEAMPFLIKDAPHWVAWWLEREVGEVDASDPQQIARAEAGFKRILQVLPEGALREYVRREARKRLNSLPAIPAARVRTQRQIDRCKWAERRALRLYLLDEGSRPALAEISYGDGVIRKAWAIIQTLEGMGTSGEHLRSCFVGVITRLDPDLCDELQSLARPIGEVARVIEANPLGELEGALAALSAECCQDANDDR